MSRKIAILIFTSFLIVFNQGIFAQSLKKTFSYIEKGEIEKADLEIKQFTNDIKKSNIDVSLYGIASCLILNNEEYQKYDPYKSLELYEGTKKINANASEVDKFLNKYNLSIEKIQGMIFQNILKDAKEKNTEETYKKALSVCKQCFYEEEVVKLKEVSAYNEAKKGNSIQSLKYFINTYPNSEYKTEIKELLEETAFWKAKIQMTLSSLDSYINEFSRSENKHLSEAIHLRDSIAFSHVNKTYNDFLNFQKQNPKSEYNSLIIQELPNLLYNQAVKEKDLKLLESFIVQYPNDYRIASANQQLEFLYFIKLSNELSSMDLGEFRRRYPESIYTQQLIDIYSKVTSNNDLKREELKGAIKSVETIGYLDYKNDEKKIGCIIRKHYNDLGNIVLIEAAGTYNDDIDDFLRSYVPDKYQNEMEVQIATLGVVKPVFTHFNVGNIQSYGYANYLQVHFEYDKNGKLVKVSGKNDGRFTKWEFNYDTEGNLIIKDILNTPYGINSTYNLQYRIKYIWDNGKLLSKHIYTGDGEKYKLLDFKYKEGNTIITETNKDFNYIVSKTTLEYKDYSHILRRNSETIRNNDWVTREISDYSYWDGLVTNVHIIRQAHFEKLPETGDYTYNIIRDEFGQVSAIKTQPFFKISDKVWEYKCDTEGNWIERIEYQISGTGSKIPLALIRRNISYYY